MKRWRERIAEARARGRFSVEDYHASGEWETCAVGEQHAQLPHVVVYQEGHCRKPCPVDERLHALGAYQHGGYLGFHGAIEYNEMETAERHLDQIEDRVLELKREAAS